MNRLWLLLGDDMRKVKSDAVGRNEVSPYSPPSLAQILSGHI
jgi:hypothetical protein